MRQGFIKTPKKGFQSADQDLLVGDDSLRTGSMAMVPRRRKTQVAGTRHTPRVRIVRDPADSPRLPVKHEAPEGFDRLFCDQAVLCSDVLLVSGWTICRTVPARIEIYLSGGFVGEAERDLPRPDVQIRLPAMTKNLNSGFRFCEDISRVLGKRVSKRDVLIRAIAADGETTEIRVPCKSLPCQLYCDEVTLYCDALLVNGWALANDPIDRIAIYVDSQFLGNATLGIPRADVQAALPALSKDSHSGFHLYAALPYWFRPGGDQHRVVIKAMANHHLVGEQSILCTPRAFVLYCDEILLYEDAVVVKGWAMAEMGLDRIELYVDGHFIGTAESGIPRPDVEEAFPSVKKSSGSGFYLSASKPSMLNCGAGKHIVSIRAIDVSGQRREISRHCVEESFQVRCEEVTLLPDAVIVRGWARADMGIEGIEVHVDNHFVGKTTYGIPRPDLEKVYPWSEDRNDFGFHLRERVSHMAESDAGMHDILLRARRNDGAVRDVWKRCRKEIRFVCCERAKLCSDSLELDGWAVSDDGIARVLVFLDGRFLGETEYGLARLDVGKLYPHLFRSDAAGFRFSSSFDDLGYDVKEHRIDLWAMTETGLKAETVQTLQMTPRQILWCEHAVVFSDAIQVVGWAISDEDIATIEIYLDNTFIGIADHGQNRPDVASEHPTIGNSSHSGFSLYEDLENEWSTSEDVRHTVLIKAINQNGQWFQIEAPARLQERSRDESSTLAAVKLKAFLETTNSMIFPVFDNPILTIIVVLFNRSELTFQCLESIKAHADVSYEIVIIDNASQDETRDLLEALNNVTVIKNNKNVGFLKACNQALEYAHGEYLLFLNNDTQVLPNAFSRLVDTIESDQSIGVVGGKLIFPDGKLQEAGSIIWNDGSCLGYGRNDDPSKPEYSYLREVHYCSGALLLTPRKLFLELGMFDETYSPAYSEEADYCLRIREEGYKAVYQPSAEIIHREFASSKKANEAIRLQETNRKKLAKKWSPVLVEYYKPQENNILFAREFSVNGNRKRLLFVDDQIPDPKIGSGFPRSFDMLTTLAESGYQVTFFPLQAALEKPKTVTNYLQQKGIEVIYEHTGRKAKLSFRAFLRGRRNYYDMMLVSRPHNMKEVLKSKNLLGNRVKIIYDCEALFAARELLYMEIRGQKIGVQQKASLIREEIHLAEQADCVTTVSRDEMETFERYGIENVRVVAHAIDTNPTPTTFGQRKDILFVGGILHSPSPNEDAIIYFVREIYPMVYKKTGTRLYIVGTNKSRSVWDLESNHITVTGRVESVREFHGRSRIFIVPTRYAAGSPYKFHEASAHGIPSVVTPLIADEVAGKEGKDLLIGRNEKDFAQKCIELYTKEDLWKTIRNGALELVKRDCCRQAFKESICGALEG